MTVLIEIPENEIISLMEWSQEHDSEVLMKSSEELSSEYLSELLERTKTPLDQCRNAHERLAEIEKDYGV